MLFIVFLIRLLLILNDVLDLWLNHVLPFLNLRLLIRFLMLVWYLGNRGLLAMNGGQELLSLVQWLHLRGQWSRQFRFPSWKPSPMNGFISGTSCNTLIERFHIKVLLLHRCLRPELLALHVLQLSWGLIGCAKTYLLLMHTGCSRYLSLSDKNSCWLSGVIKLVSINGWRMPRCLGPWDCSASLLPRDCCLLCRCSSSNTIIFTGGLLSLNVNIIDFLLFSTTLFDLFSGLGSLDNWNLGQIVVFIVFVAVPETILPIRVTLAILYNMIFILQLLLLTLVFFILIFFDIFSVLIRVYIFLIFVDVSAFFLILRYFNNFLAF